MLARTFSVHAARFPRVNRSKYRPLQILMTAAILAVGMSAVSAASSFAWHLTLTKSVQVNATAPSNYLRQPAGSTTPVTNANVGDTLYYKIVVGIQPGTVPYGQSINDVVVSDLGCGSLTTAPGGGGTVQPVSGISLTNDNIHNTATYYCSHKLLSTAGLSPGASPLAGIYPNTATAVGYNGTEKIVPTPASVYVGVLQPATVVIKEVTAPTGSATPFPFTWSSLAPAGDSGFSLLDSGVHTTINVAPGSSYSATQATPADYSLTGISCTGGSASTNGATATMTPQAGQTVTCVFTDTVIPTAVGSTPPPVTATPSGPQLGTTTPSTGPASSGVLGIRVAQHKKLKRIRHRRIRHQRRHVTPRFTG